MFYCVKDKRFKGDLSGFKPRLDTGFSEDFRVSSVANYNLVRLAKNFVSVYHELFRRSPKDIDFRVDPMFLEDAIFFLDVDFDRPYEVLSQSEFSDEINVLLTTVRDSVGGTLNSCLNEAAVNHNSLMRDYGLSPRFYARMVDKHLFFENRFIGRVPMSEANIAVRDCLRQVCDFTLENQVNIVVDLFSGLADFDISERKFENVLNDLEGEARSIISSSYERAGHYALEELVDLLRA